MLLTSLSASAALVLPRPPRHTTTVASVRSASHAAAAARASPLRMQVEAPVKIPDKVPNLAPSKPNADKANEKAKKYKVLLFNDNVNRCAYGRPTHPARTRGALHDKRVITHICSFLELTGTCSLLRRRREYVARVLVGSIPGMSQADAYVVMQKAHKQGMAVVGIWVYEMAEAYCDKLKAGGLISSVTEED